MSYAVLKGAGYVLVHAPNMVIHCGSTQTTERITNPDSEYLKKLPECLRTFEEACNYAPNQVYIGSMKPEELKEIAFPWYDKGSKIKDRFGKLGEIMPEDEFIGLLQAADAFDLVKLTAEFSTHVKEKLSKHPLLSDTADKIKAGEELAVIEAAIKDIGAEGLYFDNKLVGCIKRAHDIDVNLNAHVIFENLVAKASAYLAIKNLVEKNGINIKDIDYVIECSEEACGDMNQRGGGNFAKAIAEMAGATNATGSDLRGFCAAPTHALIEAASLVKAGTFENVVVVAGGSTAKLGMNGKDHVKKDIPIIEDVIGGFAFLISKDDGVNPWLNTDVVGMHTVGTGSAPQAVISSLVTNPLDKNGLKITDIDKYSVEMQNPDITKPAGAGDVPEANYKMIGALSVMRGEIQKADILSFIEKHGMPGFAPTQGHIPSGVPYVGFAKDELTTGDLNKVMIVGKGSLFLGRMTNLFDGVSIVMERNPGKTIEVPSAASSTGKRYKIGLTTYGSEHGSANLIEGAILSVTQNEGYDVVLIGEKPSCQLPAGIEVIETTEAEMHKKMEELLDKGQIDGCVTMHYNFPIGVSTVGKVVTPGMGKEMILATTTGTTATDRVEAMVRNAVYGIATAKAMGITKPTVGILNLDGARTVENALLKLKAGGFEVNFSESVRSDGGAVMRGNDLLCGAADVMVMDTLTGNIMMKMMSSFTTGGSYEATGYGYGPGIGENYNRLVLILSRASGVPVVANAIKYAAQLAKGDVKKVVRATIDSAKKAGLNDIIASFNKPAAAVETIKAPDKEIVTEEIAGIDIMSLEDAVQELWKAGIYAESGMGCTGPVVLVNTAKAEKAVEILRKAEFITE